MEQLVCMLCFAVCLLLPILWGSVYGWLQDTIPQLHTEKRTCCWLLDGWIVYLAGFALLAVFARLSGWQWHRLYVMGMFYGGALTLFCAALWMTDSYRAYIKKQLAAVFSKEGALVWGAYAAGFVLIGLIYLRQGVVLELYHTLPEEVTYVLATGMRGTADLSAFYATLAALAGLRTEQVLFQIMPYVWLCVCLNAVTGAAQHFFEGAREKALLLLAFTFVVLCGSGAHMNVPYAVLHAPYEGDALMGSLVVLYLLGTWLGLLDRKTRWPGLLLQTGMGLACAYLLAGLVQGLVLGAVQTVLLLTAAALLRLAGRERQV